MMMPGWSIAHVRVEEVQSPAGVHPVIWAVRMRLEEGR
jgi:hypothetical protein